MDRAKAIEWLEQLRDEEELNAKLFEISEHPRDMDNPHTPWVEMYETALAALREQLVTGCNQWISVEERLPEVGQRVLVWCESRTIEKHITVSTFMQTYSTPRKTYFSRRVWNVTHWMPLPELPEGGAK